mmetsp:Transcript_133830/g.317201  ORF Transcript_133830/g.317201 Transcript_133830/m.317201 type:complete len:206 (+) Transcript_133830:343-960(+)
MPGSDSIGLRCWHWRHQGRCWSFLFSRQFPRLLSRFLLELWHFSLEFQLQLAFHGLHLFQGHGFEGLAVTLDHRLAIAAPADKGPQLIQVGGCGGLRGWKMVSHLMHELQQALVHLPLKVAQGQVVVVLSKGHLQLGRHLVQREHSKDRQESNRNCPLITGHHGCHDQRRENGMDHQEQHDDLRPREGKVGVLDLHRIQKIHESA